MGVIGSIDRLCVVIPAYNEGLLIGRCIESVLQAGIPAANVYVADDRSTDTTAAIVARCQGVQIVTSGQQLGKLGGVRNAIAHFDLARRYEYLSLLDADSHVASDYFINVLTEFEAQSDTVLVCGAPSSDRFNWLTAYRALEYTISRKTYREGQGSLGVITVAPGCASTYRTSILGMFDWDGGTLVEDMDLTIQVHRRRLGHIAFARDAITHTQDPRRLSEYIGQMTRWYSGTWQVMRLHRLPFGRQRVDAEFALLMTEGMLYAVVLLLLPLIALFWPRMVMQGLILDQAIWLTLAAVGAMYLRRLDVLIWMPTFLVLRFVNAVVLLRTFWLEMVRGQRQSHWFSVSRYLASQPEIASQPRDA